MAYNKFSLILFFLSYCLVCFSQKKDDIRIIDEAGDVTGGFDKINYYKTTRIPFRDILVFDKRFDTSKLGYTNSNLRIHPDNTWSSILNTYFKNNLDPSSDKSLVIFIKSYWMQRGIVDKVIRKKLVLKSAVGGSELNLEAGCFRKIR
jgi:hypothetical protein